MFRLCIKLLSLFHCCLECQAERTVDGIWASVDRGSSISLFGTSESGDRLNGGHREIDQRLTWGNPVTSGRFLGATEDLDNTALRNQLSQACRVGGRFLTMGC